MIDLIEQHRAELQELCRRYRVKKLEVFGSAADGAWDRVRSDLDFLVEFLPDQDLGPWLRHYFDFKDQLERLLERPVDLVFGTSLKNPYFIREVNRTRKTLYAA
jgi:uncharacterized protein